MKESDGYYNELNLLNEKLDSYEQFQNLYLSLSDVERIIKDIKFDIKRSIKEFIRDILVAFEDVFVYFDAWKSGIVYRINLLRLDPDRRIFIDFIISEEGQQGYADTTIRPVLASVENTSPYMLPFSEINVAYEDIAYCAEMKSEWSERWIDILTR